MKKKLIQLHMNTNKISLIQTETYKIFEKIIVKHVKLNEKA